MIPAKILPKRRRCPIKPSIEKAAVGFEPTNNGFAIRPLSPLGHAAAPSKHPTHFEAGRGIPVDSTGSSTGWNAAKPQVRLLWEPEGATPITDRPALCKAGWHDTRPTKIQAKKQGVLYQASRSGSSSAEGLTDRCLLRFTRKPHRTLRFRGWRRCRILAESHDRRWPQGAPAREKLPRLRARPRWIELIPPR